MSTPSSAPEVRQPGQRARVEPFFLAGRFGRLFAIHYSASGSPPSRQLLVVPPFAEEMNKSRRVLAEQARALAACGFGVTQIDLTGTGDSAGDFRDADWELWKADLSAASAWLLERYPGAVLYVLGIRSGCLLAADWIAAHAVRVRRLLFWQPVLSGEQFLGQFLRLRVMANKFAGIEESVADLIARLQRGESVEVAGYELNPTLALQLQRAGMDGFDPPADCALDWFDVSPTVRSEPPVPAQKLMQRWEERGVPVRYHAVAGETFWNTLEIAVPQALIAATTECLTRDA